jgi:DNA-binding transcriptional LysR family regulator
MLNSSQVKRLFIIEGVFMNLQDLIYFKHLSESLSFTQTAKHFYVSQPSISTALKRLETELEATLIDRRKTLKQIQLTPAGKILYKDAQEVVERLRATKQKIHDLEEENVYYGFLPTIGGHFLPKIMPKLGRFETSVTFIEEESSDIMLNNVQQEKVPIAIIGHETPKIQDKRLTQYPILNEQMGLWVSPNHGLAGKSSINVEDIQDEMLISLSEGYTHQRIFEQWARANNINEPNIVYAKEIQTVHSIAASTSMMAFMSDIIVGENSGLVKVPLNKAPKFYISLIFNTDMENTFIQQEFNETIIEAVKSEFG